MKRFFEDRTEELLILLYIFICVYFYIACCAKHIIAWTERNKRNKKE